MSQLHKRFTPDQVKELVQHYSKNEIERKYPQEILGIKCEGKLIDVQKVQNSDLPSVYLAPQKAP